MLQMPCALHCPRSVPMDAQNAAQGDINIPFPIYATTGFTVDWGGKRQVARLACRKSCVLLHVFEVDFSVRMSDSSLIGTNLQDAASRVLSPCTFFVWLACIVLGIVAGPFDTLHAMDFPVRGLFWVIIVTLAVVIGYGVRAFAMIVVGPEQTRLFDLIAILTMTGVFTPVVWVMGHGFERVFAAEVPPLHVVGFYVLLVSTAVFMIRRIAPGFEPRPEGEEATEGWASSAAFMREPRLIRRLPPEQRSDILRLTANGHYIAVVTITGEETLRMRLADAILEMEPVPGLCTHRSHWVAHHAISHGERKDAQKAYVVLVNGDKVPVSRKYRPELEALGLL